MTDSRSARTTLKGGFPTFTAMFLSAVCLLLLTQPAGAQLQFRTSIVAPIEQVPSGMLQADLNGDGVTDIVISHAVHAAVSVFLGDSAGGLLPPDEFEVGGPTRSVVLADIDEDSVPDLLVTEEESDNAWFLHGFGDGTFDAAKLILVGHDPVDIAVRDLDGDEHVDLAVALADEAGGQISVLKGRGDGTFAAPSITPLQSIAAQEVVIDDFNADQIPDIAVSNIEPGSVAVLLGTGELNFAQAVIIPTGPSTSPLELADVDEDGRPDLIAGVSGLDAVAVLISNGDGTFAEPVLYTGGGTVLNSLRVTDINGDDDLDIVTSNLRSQSATVLLGAGNGTFGSPRSFIADVGPLDLEALDVNRDGHPDIVTANQGVSSLMPTLAYLYGDGAGAFRGVEQLTAVLPTLSGAVGDFDGDAITDAALVESGEARVTLRFGGAGEPRRPHQTLALSAPSVAIAAADVDADGYIDLVAANTEATLSLLYGRAPAGFEAAVTVPLGAAASGLALGDCDGDGDGDVLVSEAGTRIQLAVVRNNSARTFTTLAPTLIDGRTAGLSFSDFTGDNVLDIVVGDGDGSRLLLLTGKGDCTFTQPGPTALSTIPVRLAAVRLADDNVDDLVVLGAGQRNMIAVLNDGTGIFTPQQPRSGGNFPLGIAVRDLDADAISELVLGDRTADSVVLVRRTGMGIIASEQEVLSSIRPADILTGDFDGDGRYDILATGTTTTEIINETAVAPLRRGDANGDTRHSIADVTALLLELYDNDGARVDDVPNGDFQGNQGADANGDGSVNRLDLTPILAHLTM